MQARAIYVLSLTGVSLSVALRTVRYQTTLVRILPIAANVSSRNYFFYKSVFNFFFVYHVG